MKNNSNHSQKKSDSEGLNVPKELMNYVVSFKNYSFQRKIGTGSYGDVWQGTEVTTGKKVAIKKLYKLSTSHSRKRYIFEVTALSKSKNPFLLGLIGFTKVSPYCIITNYIPNGSLGDYLAQKYKQQLSMTQMNFIALGIASGMQYLHEIGIIHRDLKPNNIFLGENYFPIIGDFGISREQNDSFMTRNIGSPIWMAPEVIEGNKYNEKCDVFSFAMILYQMITGILPFQNLLGLNCATNMP